eukprot:TRINITY_DN75539_c0_g1_i1.p1 TRINITY_DN75539_c0_g1~~TRINITY_DN75539_c0_g1_i1.p1  ORF type:complete len:274 (+),score=50.33 TRINITY_DN75539_c0_g1_i1:104-925(+)
MQNLKWQHGLDTVPEDLDMDFSHIFAPLSSDGECTETTSTPSDEDCPEIASPPSDRECTEATLTSPEVVILIDWDDTILPTTWLHLQGLLGADGSINALKMSSQQRTLLHELESKVTQVLWSAMSHGRVVVVTNAVEGWVQASSSAFMPDLCRVLDQLDVISARSMYECDGDASPFSWKQLAFADVLDAAFDERLQSAQQHVISIGDSMCEHAALTAMREKSNSHYAKSLKLMERPSIEVLIEEHSVMSDTLEFLAYHEGHLDLELMPERPAS